MPTVSVTVLIPEESVRSSIEMVLKVIPEDMIIVSISGDEDEENNEEDFEPEAEGNENDSWPNNSRVS